MSTAQRQRGFTLIGLLISVVIVGILMVMALQSYSGIPQQMTSGNGGSMGFSLARSRMQQIATSETTYYSIHRRYGTWEELIADGQISQGYTTRAGRSPFVPGHDLSLELTSTGFTAIATPNVHFGAAEGSPILKITESGHLEEIPQ
ncbi:MAG TPA: prepilin-type N-terminal cleavage/methylation domain-containing protein [bacterium]|jgi:prepilin-type N-terminal cleavage/methylation domain-containing protein